MIFVKLLLLVILCNCLLLFLNSCFFPTGLHLSFCLVFLSRIHSLKMVNQQNKIVFSANWSWFSMVYSSAFNFPSIFFKHDPAFSIYFACIKCCCPNSNKGVKNIFTIFFHCENVAPGFINGAPFSDFNLLIAGKAILI